MIPFNIPPLLGTELEYIADAIHSHKICGDGAYTKKCNDWFEKQMQVPKALLTTSCTHALEMSAILSEIQPGDEVIMPSYTFVSTADAFVLRGAKIVFVDIRPDTMNLDETKIEQAITKRTRAIVVVHYAGIACEMDEINEIAKKFNLFVIEDAAQGVMSYYKGKALGALGDFGCYSFHETKNYSMGEGGAILLKNENDIEKAEIIREKGTDRSKFYRGQIDKYTWVDYGSSYLPSELNAAHLWAQLEQANHINDYRMNCWEYYRDNLQELSNQEKIELQHIPDHCTHNAHMYYIKCKNLAERTALIDYLRLGEIMAVFHYIPLHSAPAGKKFGEFCGDDIYTTKESERLLRLPLYYSLERSDQNKVVEMIHQFYNKV